MSQSKRLDRNRDSPAIRAEGLTKNFDDNIAVNELRLQVFPGEIFGLVGPDGAGKSTTLRMLATILDPDSGAASITGFDIFSQAGKVKDNLAYMSQKFGLYQDLTVRENIDFYGDLYGISKKGRKERTQELLDFSNMAPFVDRRAGNLSGGMKQKLQLICALIHTPKVLLLDEPTNGVDPVSRRDFWRILHQLRKNEVGVLVTTAYLDEAERCDRVGLIDKGKLLAAGTPAEIKELMEGRILAIRSSRGRDIVQLLKGQPFCASVNVFGDRVHLVCEPGREVEQRVADLLQQTGINYQKILEIPPSLEDVFVSVLGKDEVEQGQPPTSNITDDYHPRKDGSTPATNGAGKLAVRCENLTRTFGDFIAVDKVNFQVSKGEIFGFLGPNGAGKSTTIRMLCGLLRPSSGAGAVADFDIYTETERIKLSIGYMSQKFSLYEDLTVEENINFYGGIYGLKGKALEGRKAWALEMAGLQEHRTCFTAILSGGWKQRLALACAILHEPPIIFLDEPTSGVDPLSRRRFWDLIYKMAEQGITVFVTTHYMEEAEYCDRLGLIYNGKMIASGSPFELKTEFMHDHIISLSCADPQDMIEPLAALPEIRDASLFGSGLHIVAADAASAQDSIQAFFTSQGQPVPVMEKIIPSMEDVFISLIEEVDQRNVKNGKGAGD